MGTIVIPAIWILYIVGGYIVLNAVANAMSMKDRSLYGFVFRFIRIFTMTAGAAVEQELHIKLPEIPTQAALVSDNQTAQN